MYEKETDRKLKKRDLIFIVACVVVVLTVAFVIVNIQSADHSLPLYVGLTQDEAIETLDELTEMGIRASYSDGTVYVPVNQADAVREQLDLQASFIQSTHDNDVDYSAFLTLLTKNGFQYSEAEPETFSILSAACKGVFIGDENISIYEYNSNEEMENDSAHINRDGYSVSYPDVGSHISWVSDPHFFKKDRIIVNYVGENERILEFLKETFGNTFAGRSI